MEANDTWGVASLDPIGLIGRIYVGDHSTLLYTKYISCGPHGFRDEDLYNDPQGVASLDPRGLTGRIYVGSTKHCYIQNIQAVGLMVSEKIFEVFPIISLWELYISMAAILIYGP